MPARRFKLNRIARESEDRPANRPELYLGLHEKLNELRAMGRPALEDVARLEREHEGEFARRNEERWILISVGALGADQAVNFLRRHQCWRITNRMFT